MIEGFFTTIKGLEPDDEIELAPWFSSYESHFAYGVPHSPCDIQKIRDVFLSNTVNPRSRNFLIQEKATSRRIGVMQFNNIDWNSRSISLSIMLISSEVRGKGIGTDARLSALNFVLNEWNMRYVYGSYGSYQTGIPEMNSKLGAEVVGRYENGIHIDGKYHDIIYYALSKKSFNSNYLNTKKQWEEYIKNRYCS